MSRGAFREELHRVIQDIPPPLVNNAIPFAQPATNIAGWTPPQPGIAAPPQDDGLPDPLPEFKKASSIRAATIKRPDVLIHRLLHKGCKFVLSGGSKSFKSWTLIDLALAVATGDEWWGMKTEKTKVLYINLELIEGFFDERILSVCNSRKCELPEDLLIWNLRAKCYDLKIMSRILMARIAKTPGIGMIIVDPLYKALGDLDENSASDMTVLMGQVEQLGDAIGATVVFASHFSKGNQSGKEAMDRPSGSGVFIRDPDAIMVMTKHEDENCYAVESELRYMAPLGKFVVKWEFPRMVIDESKDPNALYTGKANENKFEENQPTFSTDDILSCLTHQGMTADEWRKSVTAKFQRAGKPFYMRKAQLITSKAVEKQGDKFYPLNYKLERV